jgi:predicted dehydrogenase
MTFVLCSDQRMTINIAIVGCGKIADSHVGEIRKLTCARLVAVCDLEPIIAEQIAVRYGIPHWYSDFDRMLSEQRPDVVHIATPPRSHLALTQKAVRAGCHVFLEKPLAVNAIEGRRLIECVQQAGKKMTINYWPNFETPALGLKALVARGELGDPVHVESYYGYDLTGRFGQALLSDESHWVHHLPGKLFHNIIDHAINKITPFLSDETPQVLARAYRRRPSNDDKTDRVLDELRVMILGRSTSAYVTFCSHARPVGQFLRVYGTRNTVHVDFMLRTMLVEQFQGFPTALGRLVPPFKSSWRSFRQAAHNVGEFAGSQYHYFAGMNRLLSAFYDSILRNSAVPISYAEILRVSTIMDEIFTQVYPEDVT